MAITLLRKISVQEPINVLEVLSAVCLHSYNTILEITDVLNIFESSQLSLALSGMNIFRVA